MDTWQIILLGICLVIIIVVSILFIYLRIKNQQEIHKYLKHIEILENEYKGKKTKDDLDNLETFYKELYAEGTIDEIEFRLIMEDIENERSGDCKNQDNQLVK